MTSADAVGGPVGSGDKPATRRGRRRSDRGTLRWWVTFAWCFATIGFALGTLTLLGPVRWMTTEIRERGWPQSLENIGVILAILLLAATAAALAYYATERAMDSPRRWLRASLPLAVAGPAALALWAWMTPEFMARVNSGSQRAVQESFDFTFGPYPNDEKLRQLKRTGYTAVITLLHPAVIPFEPRLLKEETAAASRAGITLIHLPMLPWVSDNAAALDSVRRLAELDDGKYYVHCYLGVDRVSVVRQVVESVPGIRARNLERATSGRSIQSLVNGKGFERGTVAQLSDSVFLAPYPTAEEWNSFILGSGIRTVVSLLDPAREVDKGWIALERSMLARVGKKLVISPIPESGDVRAAAIAAVAAVRAAEKPVLVHGFLIPSPPVTAFIQAYGRGSP